MLSILADPAKLEAFSQCAALRTPHAWFVTGEDSLRVTTFNAAASVALVLEGRMLTLAGDIVPFNLPHAPNTDRTTKSNSQALGEGWLLDCQLRASSGTPRVGQCYAIVEVVRGLTSSQIALATLLQGYVTDTARLGWPGSALQASTAGAGALRSVLGTDPAANVEVSETVPTNARWRLHALAVTLVTDGNAANREVALTIDDGTTVLLRIPFGFTHTASLTKLYSAFCGGFINTAAQDLTRVAPLPSFTLQGGWRVNTVTTNRQATDNFGAPQLLVEEWIED